jgi:hypothetical protein
MRDFRLAVLASPREGGLPHEGTGEERPFAPNTVQLTELFVEASRGRREAGEEKLLNNNSLSSPASPASPASSASPAYPN